MKSRHLHLVGTPGYTTDMAPIQRDGLVWEGGNTVVIDGLAFPCVLMADPKGVPWDGPTHLGDPDCQKGWSVTIPFESGVLAQIIFEPAPHGDDNITLSVHYPVWNDFSDSPRGVQCLVNERKFVPPFSRRRRHHSGFWTNCEPDWLREHLLRIATFAVEQPTDGERCKFYSSLAEAQAHS